MSALAVIVGVRLLEWTRSANQGVAPDVTRCLLFRGVLSGRIVSLRTASCVCWVWLSGDCRYDLFVVLCRRMRSACRPHGGSKALDAPSVGRGCSDGQTPANRTATSRWVNKTPAQEKRRGRSGVRHIGGMWAAHTREAETAFNGWDGRRLPIPDSLRRWRQRRHRQSLQRDTARYHLIVLDDEQPPA